MEPLPSALYFDKHFIDRNINTDIDTQIFPQPHKGGISIPILQIRKVRLRQVKLLAQTHTVGMEKSKI